MAKRGWVVGALMVFAGAFLGVGQSRAATAPNVLVPQAGVGAKFGARDPYSCSSKTAPERGPITPELATQYSICRFEQVTGNGFLMLMENVHLQVGGSSGPAKRVLPFAKDAQPNGPVYPLRGSMDTYSCFAVDDSYGPHAHGQNCRLNHEPNATGQCYRTTFGDWSCLLMGNGGGQQTDGVPPPGYKPPSAAAQTPAPTAAVAPVGPIQGAANWSSATKGLPPVAQASPALGASAPPAAAPALTGEAAEVQAGMQMFLRGDYRGAYGKFHAATQEDLNDPFAKVWEGVTLDALGRSDGFDFLEGQDKQVGMASTLLLALSHWHRGDTKNAEETLNVCIRYHPEDTMCAAMKQGIESGASAPPIKDWPAITGLLKATQARATVWMPPQQP